MARPLMSFSTTCSSRNVVFLGDAQIYPKMNNFKAFSCRILTYFLSIFGYLMQPDLINVVLCPCRIIEIGTTEEGDFLKISAPYYHFFKKTKDVKLAHSFSSVAAVKPSRDVQYVTHLLHTSPAVVCELMEILQEPPPWQYTVVLISCLSSRAAISS